VLIWAVVAEEEEAPSQENGGAFGSPRIAVKAASGGLASGWDWAFAGFL
jgi:hypothetical protein